MVTQHNATRHDHKNTHMPHTIQVIERVGQRDKELRAVEAAAAAGHAHCAALGVPHVLADFIFKETLVLALKKPINTEAG